MAGAVSALFLLDIKGRVLIWRDYRGDVSAVQAERFFTKLIEKVIPFLSSLFFKACTLESSWFAFVDMWGSFSSN